MLLSEAIAEFTAYRRTTDLARTTLRDSESTLGAFLAVVGDVNTAELGVLDVGRFFDAGSETRQAQSQRNDHSRLRVFFDYCRARGYMAPGQDPLFGRRRPKRVKRERNRVSVGKFPALLNAAQERSDRDRAAVAMLLFTLARDGEVGSVRIRDVNLDSGRIRMEIHKTHQEDSVPICAELDRELRRWLAIYAADCGPLQPHWFLIPSRQTRPVFEGGRIVAAEHCRYNPTVRMGPLGEAARPALDKIGFPVNGGEREGAHTIRRSGARALYEHLVSLGHDAAIRVVQSMLHHAKMAQTEDYVGLTPERKTRDDLVLGVDLYGLDLPSPLPLSA